MEDRQHPPRRRTRRSVAHAAFRSASSSRCGSALAKAAPRQKPPPITVEHAEVSHAVVAVTSRGSVEVM